jgi:hypothetical protein
MSPDLSSAHRDLTVPSAWTLAASAFNWTPEIARAERDAADIVVGIVSIGVAEVIEIEPGQTWRSFPEPDDAEVGSLRAALAAQGGSVSIVGVSIDDWAHDGHRRDDDERFAFLLPQLRAAARVGAWGVRVPLGQAGPPLLRRLQPVLHELDLTLCEEAQGRQTPTAQPAEFASIAELDDPRVRVLVDTSMLMPALPVSYLDRIGTAGLPADLVARLTDEWADPATHAAVMAALQNGDVPPVLMTLYMDLVVRFGRSSASELRPVLPLVSGIHLKFWDLDDTDYRVSAPLRDLGGELATAGFAGTLCSEWGGHAWLDDDPTDMTRAHLALAESALATGAASRIHP